ncbi:RNA polymerase sigma factor (sigma-70 family) [Dyadobacter jejuensis]|uniref:RNA polymerase sigma factor (Sigma-70 family) n=1 Tax=Dyadobacter jejuensis TaxID=1082580 RepID=A0A316AJ05_9BACT|nr:sigma-70 family RNA polymerase sigma factor [Dyadobacter jejuensis]PWJ56860.1 RNA polymerase sigma factor (sigma-70 family) [Dyadobacter jejuensis]
MEVRKSIGRYGEVDPLWKALKEGEVSAYERIFHLYYEPLFNYGCRFHKDSEEVRDCIQMLFLTIWERREFLGSSDNIRNYLFSSLRRLVLKRLKLNQNKFVDMDTSDIDFYADLSFEAVYINDETSGENVLALQEALEKLPARQKEALFLRFYGDHSFGDIAQIMNITTRAVYKLIYKSLEALNRELQPKMKTQNIPYILSILF